MSNNIDQENPSGSDDNADGTNDIPGENNYFRCTSCKVWSLLTYRGLNQLLRTCLRKTRDVIVTDSQPASSRAVNNLQSATESTTPERKRDCQWRIHKWGERNLREVSKKIQDANERIVFWKKNLFMLPAGAAAKKYITDNKTDEWMDEQFTF